jgi:Dinucleotide-utilizing enzymes involved in molybdopterin and thiamine biosynthesis family 2
MYNFDKYQRQLLLPGMDIHQQQALSKARVLIIGTGGLGCPALTALAGMGVGHITIVDGDVVKYSNLHRQFLFDADDVEQPKAYVAFQKMSKQYPEITWTYQQDFFTKLNAISLVTVHDYVIDCSDIFLHVTS